MFSVLFAVGLLAAAPTPPAPPPAVTPAPAPEQMPQPTVWLGVFLDDAADGGVQVLGLVPGGPADRVGMQAGDVVLGVGSVSVLDLEALNQMLLTMKPGQRAELRILRDGSVQTVPLLLGDRSKVPVDVTPLTPPPPRPPRFRDTLGMEVVDIPAELRKHYGAPPDAGALVVKLESDGPGARAGLRVGDVVVRSGERRVQGPADVLVGVISASGDQVPIEVVRSRKTLSVSVTRPAVPRPGRRMVAGNDARVVELTAEVDRLRARVAELEAELEKARRE